jgi:hypothetical protein
LNIIIKPNLSIFIKILKLLAEALKLQILIKYLATNIFLTYRPLAIRHSSEDMPAASQGQ